MNPTAPNTAEFMDDTPPNEGTVVETVSLSAYEGGERARADVAVVTAKRYPRTISGFLRDLETWACGSAGMAEECFYALKRKSRDGTETTILGPSVRFAELLLVAYRNLAVTVRLDSDDGKVVTVVGACRDMERNVGQEVPVSRRVTDRNGRRYSDDMVNVTIQAAGAIAKRNAIIGVVPKAMWMPVWEKAKALARGDLKSISERVQAAVAAFGKVGVSEARMCASVGKPAVKDLDADDLLLLHVTLRAIKDGEMDPAEVGAQTDVAPAATEAAAEATAAVARGATKGRSAKAPAAPATKQEEPGRTAPPEPAKQPAEQAPPPAAPKPGVAEGMV